MKLESPLSWTWILLHLHIRASTICLTKFRKASMQPPVWNKLIPYRIKTFALTLIRSSASYFFLLQMCQKFAALMYLNHTVTLPPPTAMPIVFQSPEPVRRLCTLTRVAHSTVGLRLQQYSQSATMTLIGFATDTDWLEVPLVWSEPLRAHSMPTSDHVYRSIFFFTTHPVFIYGLAVKTLPSSSSPP